MVKQGLMYKGEDEEEEVDLHGRKKQRNNQEISKHPRSIQINNEEGEIENDKDPFIQFLFIKSKS